MLQTTRQYVFRPPGPSGLSSAHAARNTHKPMGRLGAEITLSTKQVAGRHCQRRHSPSFYKSVSEMLPFQTKPP